ncbi:pilus assembly protein PilP [Roseateles sp. BYS78W]|uniref:Pilus assembly protein PilP n=1 Tax=Pelomonas candidula TaxID=3299025 RepID=A0ABW7HAG0_9BURK
MIARRLLLVHLLGLWAASASATRERQALEAFDLDSLRWVGQQTLDCVRYGVVRDPGGYLHRVFKGDFVGRNFGRVMDISDDGLRLREVVQDVRGEWVEREAWLRSGMK